jgi:hypothetical protein
VLKKRLILTILAVVSIFGLLAGVSCSRIVGSGPSTTREYNFADFTNLELSHGFNVIVSASNSYKVTVTVPENVVSHLEVSQSGKTVKIGLQPIIYAGSRLQAEVTMPVLARLSLSGGSFCRAAGFSSTQALDLLASGGSEIELDMAAGQTNINISGGGQVTGNYTFTDASIELSGGSRVEFDGKGNNITKLEASGGSKAILPKLALQNADMNLNGGSQADLTVNGKLTVRLSGGSSLKYSGNPQIDQINVSGGSSISRK